MSEEALRQMNNLRKATEAKNQENWKVKSRERLEKIVTSKMRTLMIGSLDAIEKNFGELWNNGVPTTELENESYKTWLFLRQTILDAGNKHIRAIRKEIEQYDVDWNRCKGIGQLIGGNNGENEVRD